jgi:transposase InsO family protein
LYARKKRGESARILEDRELGQEILEVHVKSKRRYGSPRIHRALRRRGRKVGRKRVARLLRQQGLQARRPRRFRVTTDSKHSLPVAPNHLNRRFRARRPDRVWLGDITYFWTSEGWLYLAVLMDLCTRKIVGWATASRLTEDLAHRALKSALANRRPPKRLLHHTDRGSQYASHAYRETLRRHGLRLSMSRKGNCWDNAPMESFFSSMKTELDLELPPSTREACHAEVFEYIEAFYNRERLHSSIGYMSPDEFERKLANQR